MRPRRRTLRELWAGARMTPEERADLCAERCLEALCEPEHVPAGDFGEHEQEALEAERRRWAASH
jgi:hypothetical protein